MQTLRCNPKDLRPARCARRSRPLSLCVRANEALLGRDLKSVFWYIPRQSVPMTKLLQQAFDEASKLPEAEQDGLGRLLLEELASERRWDELFGGSHDLLAELAR